MKYNKTAWQDHIVDGGGNVIQQGTPLSASNLRKLEAGIADAQATLASELAAAAAHSGVLEYVSTIGNLVFSHMNRGQPGVISSGGVTWENKIVLGTFNALIKGNVIEIGNGTEETGIQLDPPPTSGERTDLILLEAWRDMITQEWKHRYRTVSGVNFKKYPEGVLTGGSAWVEAQTFAQGGNVAPLGLAEDVTITAFHDIVFGPWGPTNDKGLFLAGKGDETSKGVLKTYDGYVYAIPLFKIPRRNTAAYHPDTNPNGATVHTADFLPLVFTVGSNIATIPAGQTLPDRVVVGYTMNTGAVSGTSLVTAISGRTAGATITIDKGAGVTTTSTAEFNPVSERPDGLYSNIIAESDFEGGDLRHLVSLTGFNSQALLEKGVDMLMRSGQLKTERPAKYARDYIGLNPGAYGDDASTLLYCTFDNGLNGTANGVPVVGTAENGAAAFTNGVQGKAFASDVNYASYPVSIPFGTNTYSVELMFRPIGWELTDTSFRPLVGFSNGAGPVLSIYKASANQFRMYYTDETGSPLDGGLSGLFTGAVPFIVNKEGWHKLRISVNNNAATMALDGVTLVEGWTVPALFAAVTKVTIGYASPVPEAAKTAIDYVRISNVARTTEQLLPANFDPYSDKILDGPNGDFSTWSDDRGGITGVNGRINPYGLSDVPNYMAARVALNGQEIRHYFTGGFTKGWQSGGAGAGIPGTYDYSGEATVVHANEVADGIRTSFTFNRPASLGIGDMYHNSQSAYYHNFTIQVNSIVIDSITGVMTATVATPPNEASGRPYVAWEMGKRHAHLIPSTKSFVIHDWTDDPMPANGVTTVFHATKYNVTCMNSVRTAATATPNAHKVEQPGGYTVGGLNSVGRTTASAAAAATTLTVASTTPFVTGQNIRISNGFGGYVLATVAAGSTGTSLNLAAGLSADVPAGATVEGAAIVTFTTAPAAGTVTLVYETVYTPALGDYIRVAYNRTPYQGRIDSVSDGGVVGAWAAGLGRGILTTRGTGVLRLNEALDSHYERLSTRLPLGKDVTDAMLKSDTPVLPSKGTLNGNFGFIDEAQYYAPFNWSTSEYKASYMYKVAAGGPGGFLGKRGWNAVGYGGGLPGLIYEPLTSSVPSLVISANLITTPSGELHMLIGTHYSASTSQAFGGSADNYTAFDIFRLPGRPLVKSHGGVTN
jgi:hypothetical protein